MGADNSKISHCMCKSHLKFKSEDDSVRCEPLTSDPRLPLNSRQVFKLKASWKGIRRQTGAAGLEMFIK